MHVSSSDQPCTSLLLSILPHTMTIWGPSKEFFNRLCLAEITLACILGHRCKGFVQVTESDIAISLVNVLKLLYFEAFKLTCPLQTKRLAPTISHLNNFFFFLRNARSSICYHHSGVFFHEFDKIKINFVIFLVKSRRPTSWQTITLASRDWFLICHLSCSEKKKVFVSIFPSPII
jgi:hypothetical protein